MSSSFTWLDYSERERRVMLDVVDLFREQDTRDELGLATVRDSFSELLFPGTGSLQTRARYFLFTPWIYLALEAKEVPSGKVEARARQLEVEVIDALKEREGSGAGVIGAVSGAALRRLPSSIYWLGLSKWGILRFRGAQDAYHGFLDRFYERRDGRLKTDDGEHVEHGGARNWDAGLPLAPGGFPGSAAFALTVGEASYLREQVLKNVPHSLLSFLVAGAHASGPDGDYAWEDPDCTRAPEPLATHLRHARCFAEAMHGASLLYNLMLSELKKHKDWVAEYEARLREWAQEVAARRPDLAAWWQEREVLWRLAAGARGSPIPLPVQVFVGRWVTWLLEQSGMPDPGASAVARSLVREREEQLKRGQSRFRNQRALELFGGSAGAGRLDYRWGSVKRVVGDIRAGLGGRAHA